MKYDDLDFHVGGEFPDDVGDEHGWTHIGVFLIWLLEHDLHDPEWFEDVADRIRERSLAPPDLIDHCDGKLVDELLSPEGNAFAEAMYDGYLELYEERMTAHVNGWRSLLRRMTGNELTAYHADPGRRTYDLMAPLIDGLYADWKAGRRPAATGAWARNYDAMGDTKLLRCIDELRERSGDAFDRVLAHAADPDAHLAAAERVARERGLL